MQRLAAIFKRNDGAAAAVIALSFPALLGAAALAVDGGWIYVHNAKLQHAADASALGGATLALPNDLDQDYTTGQVKDHMVPIGHANVNGSVSETDVAFGCWAGNFKIGPCPDGLANAVEVITRENDLPLFFASLFGYKTIDLARRAVAAKLSAPACLITLNKEAVDDETVVGLSYGGSTELTMPSCGMHVNGRIDGKGNDGKGSEASVDTTYLCAGSKSHRTKISTIRAPYREHCGSLEDPYHGMKLPLQLRDKTSVKSDTLLFEGIYCKIDIDGNVILNPGKYVIDPTHCDPDDKGKKGKLSVKGDVVGDGVTIILQNGATLDLGGSSSISLKAPTGGFVLFENDGTKDPKTGGNFISKLGGAGSVEIEGLVYLKDQTLLMHGNPNIEDDSWSAAVAGAIVVDKLEIKGNAKLSLRPPPSAQFDKTPQVPTRPHLVE